METLKKEFHVNDFNYWINKTKEFETYFSKLYNTNLEELSRENLNGVETIAKERISLYSKNASHNPKQIKTLLKKYPKNLENNSLILNKDELNILIEDVYETSFLHYILGKSEGMTDEYFPYGCCNISTKNLLLHNLNQGLPSGAFIWSDLGETGHAYFAIPFMVEDFAGLIINDPTSNQLGQEKTTGIKLPKNLIMVATPEDFNYKTDFHSGKNLIPDSFLSISELRRVYFQEDLDTREGIHHFYKEAYENPISLSSFSQNQTPTRNNCNKKQTK